MIPNGRANSYPVLTERNLVDGVAIAVRASSMCTGVHHRGSTCWLGGWLPLPTLHSPGPGVVGP